MQSEQERVQQIMDDMADGNDVGSRLVYDKDQKKLRPVGPREDPDRVLRITPRDLEVFADEAVLRVITIPCEQLESLGAKGGSCRVSVACWDDGESAIVLGPESAGREFGTIAVTRDSINLNPDTFGAPDDRIRVAVSELVDAAGTTKKESEPARFQGAG